MPTEHKADAVKWSSLVFIVVCAVVGVAGCQDKATTTAAPAVYDRQEFKAMVVGKTPNEVLSLLGKPNSTSDYDTYQTWVYEERTRDMVTGKIDSRTILEFRDGKVTGVTY